MNEYMYNNREDDVNQLLESGIKRINNILNFSYDKNNHFKISQDFNDINRYSDKELSEILRDTRIRNNELLHIITLQKSDFYEMEKRYVNLADEYNTFLERYEYSEKIRMEQMNLIKSMQDKLDEIRGVDKIINNECNSSTDKMGKNIKVDNSNKSKFGNSNLKQSRPASGSNFTKSSSTKKIGTSKSSAKMKN